MRWGMPKINLNPVYWTGYVHGWWTSAYGEGRQNGFITRMTVMAERSKKVIDRAEAAGISVMRPHIFVAGEPTTDPSQFN